MKAYCDNCWADFDRTHANQKYCDPCKKLSRRGRFVSLTPDQEEKIRKLARTMKIDDLAKEVGISNSTLDRWAKRNNVNINWLKYDESTVLRVCTHYEKHGKIATQKKFPDVSVRAIIERYFARLAFKPRQVRWEASQLHELVKMAGIICFENQAHYFGRPNAGIGSVRSSWIKKFGFGSSCMNGLPKWKAQHFVRESCPYLDTDFGKRTDGKERTLALWVDIERHLKNDATEEVRIAIRALAKFQRWIHGRNVRANIQRMIDERSRQS